MIPTHVEDLLWDLATDIAIVAVAVVAILTTAKQVGRVLDRTRGRCLDLPAVQVVMEFAPLAIGALLGLAPGLFDGHPWTLRAVFGLIAGYISPGIYGHLKKRLPGIMLTKEARSDG